MQITQRGIIYSDDRPDSATRVACFPSLARLADGRILCTFKVGTTKESADETLRIAQSSDEGNTWQMTSFAPNTSLGDTPGCLRIAHLIEVQPNQLLLITNWIKRENPDEPICHPETAGLLEMRLIAFRSTDGGATWSDAEDLTKYSPVEQPEVSGPIISLAKEGHFLLPMENQKQYHDPNPINERAFALISRDFGATWNEWAMIAHRFPDYKHWCNRVARLPASGKLLCFSWTFDEKTQQDLPIHLIHGSADGREWSEPKSTGVEGQLSTPFPLSESTVLMGYVHRHQPASIRLRKSTDGGQSWDAEEELIIFSGADNAPTDGRGGDLADYYRFLTHYTFGWNPMLGLKDGRVLMAYFAGTPEKMDIRFVHLAV